MQQDYLNEYIKILNTDPTIRLPKDVNVLMKGTRDIAFFKNYLDKGEKRVHILCCTYMKHQSNQRGDEVLKIGEINDKLFILLKGQAGLMMLQPKITKQQEDEFESTKKNEESKDGDLQKKQDQNNGGGGEDSSVVDQKSKQPTINEFTDKRTRNASQVTNEDSALQIFKKERKEKNEQVYESRKSSSISLDSNLKFKNLEGIKKQQPSALIDINSKNASILAKQQGQDIKIIKQEQIEVIEQPILELVQAKLLEKGDIFGEVSLVQNRPSIFAVHCLTECQFAILEKKEFDFILGQLEEQRIYREMRFLGSLDYFMHWSSNQIKYLYIASKTLSYKRNQLVFSENDPTEYIYIVKTGTFEKIKTIDYDMTKDISFLDIKGASEQLVETINIKYRLFYIKDDKRTLRLSIIGENELFGEEDILDKNPERTFSVVCVSQSGEVVMIKKRDFYQKVLDSDQTKRIVKYRNKQKRITMKEKMQEQRNLIQEYKQYLMDNFNSNIRQVHLQEYLQTTNKDIKKSGISELLPLNLNTNLIQRYKTGQDQQTLVQQYLTNSRYQRINLKRRIYEKVNSVTNSTEQSNLLLDYVNNYKYAEPFGVVQIEYNRQKQQPRQESLDRVKELQEKQEKLRLVLRNLQLKDTKNFIGQNKGKVRSLSSQNSINSRIIHTPPVEIRRQQSNNDMSLSRIQSQLSDLSILRAQRSIKRSYSQNEHRGSENIQRNSEEISIFQPNVHKYGKLRSISQLISKNTIDSEEDYSPKKTIPSERISIKSSDVDKSLRNSKSNFNKGENQDISQSQAGSYSEFKHSLNNIVRTSNNYEKIQTHLRGFPIRIKTQNSDRDQIVYKKLNSSIQNSNKKKQIQIQTKINKNNIPLIKDFNKINSYLNN